MAGASGSSVITRDVFEDPLWKSWLHLAKEYNFRGCWSFPIETPHLKPFGTFAMYFGDAHTPSPDEMGLAEVVTQTAAIIVSRHIEAQERNRAEQTQRDSEERQRVLLEGMPQLVWRSRNGGDWTWASPQWSSFTGESAEQSAGAGWLNAVHPDDREAARLAWVTAHTSGVLDSDYRVRRASDGSYRWHHTRALPVHAPNGHISEWLGTSTDIEDLKQAQAAKLETEEQFRLFVENVHEYALVQTDPDGRISSWNPGAERMFGYTPEQTLAKDFSFLLTPEDQVNGIFPHELESVRSGQRHEDARWLVRQDGTRFWARWITEPMKDEGGCFRGLAKVMRDETEREEVEAFTRRSLTEKEELLKEVHHRVKNNLQVITSLLNMQSSQIHDEGVLALFQEPRNRVLAISSIHELLYSAESFAHIRLVEYARQQLRGTIEIVSNPGTSVSVRFSSGSQDHRE